MTSIINHIFKVICFLWLLPLYLSINNCFAEQIKANGTFILEDQKHTMTVSDALKAWEQHKFKAIGTGFNPGFTKSVFWLAVELPKQSSKEYLLRVGNAHINFIDFYRVNNNEAQLLNKTGDHFPFNSRPMNSRLFVFPVKSSTKSVSLYFLRIDKHHESLQLSAELFTKDRYYETKAYEQIMSGIFFGIVLLIVLFCLFQFLMLRDLLYLYFLSFVLFTFLWLAADKGYAYQFLWPDSPDFTSRTRPIFSSLLGITAMMFLKSFLQIKKENKFNNLLNLWMTIGFVPLILFIIPIDYSLFPDFIMVVLVAHIIWSFLVIAIMLMVVITESLKKNPNAWFYFLSFVTLVIFSTTELLIHSGSKPIYANYFSQFGIQTGIAVQFLILTFGLAYRFNVYREERMKLLVKINDEQQNHSKRLRAVQENERQKIAEQLHDDVGAMLSVASLHISSVKEQRNENHQQIQERLGIAADVLQQVSSTVRNLSHILMPFNFEKHGFISAVRSLVTTISISGKIQIEQVIIGFEEIETYNKTALLEIYRIIQELLNNILKHSEGKNAYLELIEHEDVLLILIEDNGKGIGKQKFEKRGKGISNLFAKVAYFNGVIEIHDKAEGGTMITIELPKNKLK